MFILRRRKRRIDTIRERIPKDITHNSHKRASQLFNDYTTERNTNFTRLRKAITLVFAFQMAYATIRADMPMGNEIYAKFLDHLNIKCI